MESILAAASAGLPYIFVEPFPLGPVTVHPFGLLFVAAFVVGQIAFALRARAVFGRSPRTSAEARSFALVLTWSALAGGLAYGRLTLGAALLQPAATTSLGGWLSIAMSSVGAFAGAFLGGAVYLAARRRLDALRYADVAAFAFPFAWATTRAGCALVHDHLGAASTSPLAVRFPGGARYDLGALELLGTLALLAGMLFALSALRRLGVATPPGALAAAVTMTYAALRFAVELARDPLASPAFAGQRCVSAAQVMAIGMAGLAIALGLASRARARREAAAALEAHGSSAGQRSRPAERQR